MGLCLGDVVEELQPPVACWRDFNIYWGAGWRGFNLLGCLEGFQPQKVYRGVSTSMIV